MTVILYITVALAALGALGVVFSPATIYSALSLVFTVAMLAVLYLLLDAQFLFAVQLIVYAGAVMVLFVFIIALLDPSSEERPRWVDPRFLIGCAVVLALTATIYVAARNGITYNTACTDAATSCMHAAQVGTAADPYHSIGPYTPEQVNAPSTGNTQAVAGQLFTTFLLPFELTSLLLLVSAIGAVYLTRRVGPSPKREAEARRHEVGAGPVYERADEPETAGTPV